MQWHMPIGYKVVDGKITICEEQRKIVEQIFTDYDSGVAAGRIARSETSNTRVNTSQDTKLATSPVCGAMKAGKP